MRHSTRYPRLIEPHPSHLLSLCNFTLSARERTFLGFGEAHLERASAQFEGRQNARNRSLALRALAAAVALARTAPAQKFATRAAVAPPGWRAAEWARLGG